MRRFASNSCCWNICVYIFYLFNSHSASEIVHTHHISANHVGALVVAVAVDKSSRKCFNISFSLSLSPDSFGVLTDIFFSFTSFFFFYFSLFEYFLLFFSSSHLDYFLTREMKNSCRRAKANLPNCWRMENKKIRQWIIKEENKKSSFEYVLYARKNVFLLHTKIFF